MGRKRTETNELDNYLVSFDDVLFVEEMPDSLKLDADSQASLAYNVRMGVARNVAMRNGSAREAGMTSTR